MEPPHSADLNHPTFLDIPQITFQDFPPRLLECRHKHKMASEENMQTHVIRVTQLQWDTIQALFGHNDWDLQELDIQDVAGEPTAEIQDVAAVAGINEANDIVPCPGNDEDIREQGGDINNQEPAIPPVPGSAECIHCLCTPCVTTHRQAWLGKGNPPRAGNNLIRKDKYKRFWKMMNDRGAWHDPRYQARKAQALGRGPLEEQDGYLITVREMMPDCILTLVRYLYPNPKNTRYMGHMWI